uniref:Uncharacterized protein n=1 Tax=Lepeophtheirus salmonis TaxID=72036 RepID=A0A0K2UFW1_LEPSM
MCRVCQKELYFEPSSRNRVLATSKMKKERLLVPLLLYNTIK